MRRISLLAAMLACIALPALAYDPCAGPRQAAREVQGTRDAEAQLRADYAAKIKIAPIGAVGIPPDRDGALLAEYQAKAAIAAACGAAAGGG